MVLHIKKLPSKRVNGLDAPKPNSQQKPKITPENPERLVARLRLVAMHREVSSSQAPSTDDYQALTEMLAQATGSQDSLAASDQIRRVKDALRAAGDGVRVVKVSVDQGGDAIRKLEHPLLDAAAFRTYI